MLLRTQMSAMVKAMNSELNPDTSCGWRVSKYLDPHLLLPKEYMSRKLEMEAETGLKLKL